jgi:hypothetical protein
MPAAADNPRGFFENTRVVEFNDWYLRRFHGATWDDVPPIESTPTSDDVVRRFQNLWKTEFVGDGPFLIKDPRICLLVPLWRDLLSSAGFEIRPVLIVRSPWEVAQSLATRNGFSLERSLGLWMRYLHDAERDTRNDQRVLVSYEELLQDPLAQTRRVLDHCRGGTQPDISSIEKQLRTFLSSDIRHHRETDFENPELPQSVRLTWSRISLMAKAGSSAEGLADAFETPLYAWNPSLEEMRGLLTRERVVSATAEVQRQEILQTANRRQQEIEELGNWGRRLDGELTGVRSELQAATSNLLFAQVLAQNRQEEIEKLGSWGHGLQKNLEEARQWAKDNERQLNEARNVAEARQAEVEKLGVWGHGLQKDLEEARQWAQDNERLLNEARNVAEARQAEVEKLGVWGHGLQKDLEEARQWALENERLLAEARNAAEARQAEVEKLGAWGHGLQKDLDEARQWAKDNERLLTEARNVAEARHSEVEKLGVWGRGLQKDLVEARQWAQDNERLLTEARNVAEARQAEVEKLGVWGQGLQKDLDEARQWALDNERLLVEARNVAEARQSEVEKLGAWGQGLQKELNQTREWAQNNERLLQQAREVATGRQTEIERLSIWGKNLDQVVGRLTVTISEKDDRIASQEAEIREMESRLRAERKAVLFYQAELDRIGRAMDHVQSSILWPVFRRLIRVESTQLPPVRTKIADREDA